MEMPCKSDEAKRQMVREIHAYYHDKVKPLVDMDRFRCMYRSEDAINWYTSSCFIYNIINKALRTEDTRVSYTFRYFIIDLCNFLKEQAIITRAQFDKPCRVYRGIKLDREEIEQLSVGTLIATNGFWSTSRDLNDALVQR
ncbi:unnamed protein product [Adineta steineri]|uniref:Uncharacterized protein n=1 Tax=Adineta steineri TaxID=433720 RepID=A0A819XXW0_9BILA|nr:unnamed protein product [Adineta steineri]